MYLKLLLRFFYRHGAGRGHVVGGGSVRGASSRGGPDGSCLVPVPWTRGLKKSHSFSHSPEAWKSEVTVVPSFRGLSPWFGAGRLSLCLHTSFTLCVPVSKSPPVRTPVTWG